MDKYARWNRLLELLSDSGRLSVDDAASELAVSSATVRRDFDELAQQQLLTRSRGAAVASSVSYDLPLRYRTGRQQREKQRIAAATAGMVAAGSVVGLNGGTTTTEVARALAARADLNAGDGTVALTVVTNALNIAGELTVRANVKIVVTGGVARTQSYELVGPLASGVLDAVSLDLAVLGVDAVDPHRGAFARHEGEAAINHEMATKAAEVVVVADSSKIGRRAFARICETGDVDVLVTDGQAPGDAVAAFEAAGVRVVRA